MTLLLLAAGLVSAQGGYLVKGVVEDAMGPVIGATVLQQGTTNGTTTGLDGDFVLRVPDADALDADCDASEALQGEVGEWISVVRRAGDRFFLGASTDETGRTFDQPLTFLRPGVRYTATVYGDAADAHWDTNPTAYEITTCSVTSEDTLTLRLAPGGGAAVTFLPE